MGTKNDRINPLITLVKKRMPRFWVTAPAIIIGARITGPARVGPGTWNDMLIVGPTAI